MKWVSHPEYKPCDIEWLSEVPANWGITQLGFVSWVRARLGWRGLKAEEYVNDGFTFLSTPNLKKPEIDFDDVTYIDSFRYNESPELQLRRGDVLLAKDGSTLGTVNVVRNLPRPTTVNGSIAVISPRAEVDSVYLYYLFQSSLLRHTIQRMKGGMGVPHLFQEDLRKFRIPLPSHHEQADIASFLDRETAKLDTLIAKQKRLIELLQEKRQAVISHAVTKGLDPKVPMKDSGIEWLGRVPAHWDVIRLRFLAGIQTGIAKGKDYADKPTVEVPYLRVANVQDGYLDLAYVATLLVPVEDVGRYLLRAGDVLMNEGGDFDKLGRGHVWSAEIDPCIHQNHVFAIRPHAVSSEWLTTVAGSAYAQFYFMGRSKQSTNLASISSTNIMEFPVVVPPEGEQRHILSVLRTKSAAVDMLVEKARRSIDLMSEHRLALISAAVTGKIDVREVA